MKDIFYISSGDKTRMYTLRCLREYYTPTQGHHIRDEYCGTLSRTWVEAVKKAEAEVGTCVLEAEHFDLDAGWGDRADGEPYQPRKLLSILAEQMPGVFTFGKYKELTFEYVVENDWDYMVWFVTKYQGKTKENKALHLKAVNLYGEKAEQYATEKASAVEAEKIKREKELAERKAKSEYVGEIKERKEFEVIVEKVLEFEGSSFSYYSGPTTIQMVIMRDNDGNTIVTSYSGSNENFKNYEGQTIKLVGTIKDHKEYKDEKQTVLNRVKVVK